MRQAIVKSGLLALGALATSGQVNAAPVVLSDLNSTVVYDPAIPFQMTDWFIDGEDQLVSQSFWIRTGAVPEVPISVLPVLVFATDTNPFTDLGLDHISLLYSGPGYDITVDATVRGSSGSLSDVAEQIRIVNTSLAPITFTFFQYVDMNLGDSALDDFVDFVNPNTVDQFDAEINVSETVVTPVATHHEAGIGGSILGSLLDAGPTILADTDLAGPGDVSWAFQWDFTLDPGEFYIISKDKLVVIPEPAMLSLLALPLLALVRRRL